jgi:hypothetical protein
MYKRVGLELVVITQIIQQSLFQTSSIGKSSLVSIMCVAEIFKAGLLFGDNFIKLLVGNPVHRCEILK